MVLINQYISLELKVLCLKPVNLRASDSVKLPIKSSGLYAILDIKSSTFEMTIERLPHAIVAAKKPATFISSASSKACKN